MTDDQLRDWADRHAPVGPLALGILRLLGERDAAVLLYEQVRAYSESQRAVNVSLAMRLRDASEALSRAAERQLARAGGGGRSG